MNYWLDIRLKIRDFFRRHKKKIFIILIVWAVIFAINYFLKNREVIVTPKTTYEPHSPVIDNTDPVPESYQNSINTLINNFIEYCNKKEYENAYNLLNSGFKERYCNNIDVFKKYVDNNFKTKKIYNIQNFSNVNNTYIYNVRILDDILADGTTNGYEYKEEKFAIREENGILKIALNGYCWMEDLNIIAEDEYVKIKIVKKEVLYDKVTYTVEFKNKSNYYIVFADDTEEDEIVLQIPAGTRNIKNMQDSNLVVLPNETETKELTFSKRVYDKQEETNIIFDAIRVLPEFTGYTENAEKEKAKAIKLYSLSINLK